MSRWRELVDNLLTDLKTEAPGADGFRVNIDHKIWEAEQCGPDDTVRNAGAAPSRLSALSKQLTNDPANETLLEARSLLENPWLRVPEHRRPDLRSTRSAGERSATRRGGSR
jgi:hypothetical protein